MYWKLVHDASQLVRRTHVQCKKQAEEADRSGISIDTRLESRCKTTLAEVASTEYPY